MSRTDALERDAFGQFDTYFLIPLHLRKSLNIFYKERQ
jgi:hypothetical protein